MSTYPIIFKTDDYLKGQLKIFKYGMVGGAAFVLLCLWPFLSTPAPFQLTSPLKVALVILLGSCSIYFFMKRPNSKLALTNYRVEADRFVIVEKQRVEEFSFDEYMIKGSVNSVNGIVSCILNFENSAGEKTKRAAAVKEAQFEQMLSAIDAAANAYERA